MNILLVSHRFLRHSKGGTEVLTSDIASALSKRGHQVVWLAVGEEEVEDQVSFFRREDGIIEFEITPAFSPDYPSNWYKEEAIQSEKIKRGIKELNIRFDIIHILHFARIGLHFLSLECFADSLVFMTLTDYTVVCPDYQLFNISSESICLEADNPSKCISCIDRKVSEKEIAQWRQRNIRIINDRVNIVYTQTPVQRMIMINSGIANEKLSKKTATYMIPREWDEVKVEKSNKFRFGFIGRFSPEKGLHIAIDAFAKVYDVEKCEFFIYGDNNLQTPYGQFLYEKINQCKGINYNSSVPLSELGKVLKSLDCLLIPSLWLENHPLVLTYAFSFNIKVICSDVDSLKYLKNEPNIFYVKNYKDPEAWAEMMIYIIKRNKVQKQDITALNDYRQRFEAFIDGLIQEYSL